MRKFSLISTVLVLGLLIGLAGVDGMAASKTENIELTRSNGSLKLKVHSPVSYDGSSFDPTSSVDFGTTTLKVISGGTPNWQLSVDSGYPKVTGSPSVAEKSEILKKFDVSINSSNSDGTINAQNNNATGGTGAYFVDYDYTWDAMSEENAAEYMPNGTYTITISYTVSPA